MLRRITVATASRNYQDWADLAELLKLDYPDLHASGGSRGTDHALCWINLGITHESLGDFDAALADYDEAIRLQPDSADARHRRHDILDRLRR